MHAERSMPKGGSGICAPLAGHEGLADQAGEPHQQIATWYPRSRLGAHTPGWVLTASPQSAKVFTATAAVPAADSCWGQGSPRQAQRPGRARDYLPSGWREVRLVTHHCVSAEARRKICP